MSKLFGSAAKKNKKNAAASTAEVVNKLNETRELLEKRQAHLERQRDQCKERGRVAMQAKDKQKAMFQLRLMKQFAHQIEANWGKINNLQQQCIMLESASTDQSIFDAMKMAQNKLKEIVNDDSVDQIHDIMDDLVEAQQLQGEFSDALARPTWEEVDEDELFAAFMSEDKDQVVEEKKDATKGPVITKVHTQINDQKKAIEEEEEKELEKLML